MTIDERKMTIAYADLLNIQELVQHILRMDADELFNPAAKKSICSDCDSIGHGDGLCCAICGSTY